MTRCADCERQVSAATARVHVNASGTECRVLCPWCQTAYDRSRMYSPTRLPAQSRGSLEGRGREPQ